MNSVHATEQVGSKIINRQDARRRLFCRLHGGESLWQERQLGYFSIGGQLTRLFEISKLVVSLDKMFAFWARLSA